MSIKEGTGLTHFLAIDTEATGQCMKLHFMPRFGAALVEISTGKKMDSFSTFCAQPPNTTWEPLCLDEFWLKPHNKQQYDDIIEGLKTAPSLDEAGQAFWIWTQGLVAQYGRDAMMIVSDTGGADYARLSAALPAGVSLLYIFGKYRPVLTSTSMFAGIGRTMPTNSYWGLLDSACFVLGIARPHAEVPHDHNPEHDAEVIAFEAAAIVRYLDSFSAKKKRRIEDVTRLLANN